MRPQIQVPSVIADLVRDLRDRRLLPLVGVLAIAIVAAPFALSKSDSRSNPAGPAVAGEASDSGLTIAAAPEGLRDYRSRLRGDRAKDPFLQQYAGAGASDTASDDSKEPGTGESSGGTGSGSDSDLGASGGSTGTGGSSGGSSSESGGGEPESPDEGDSGGGEVPPSPPDDGGGEENEPPYVLTLRVGQPGDTSLRELSAPEALPSEENPIVVFRGLSSDGHKAAFRVSPSVSAIFGDAECVKGTDRCEVVEVERGLPVNFVYGANDKVFRLVVVGIERND